MSSPISISGVTVVTVCSAYYLPFARSLALSLFRFHPQARMQVCLVNVAKPQVLALKKLSSRISVSEVQKKFTNIEELSIFCVQQRIEEVSKLLARGAPCVLYMDADSLIRNKLEGVLEQLAQYDVVVFQRPESLVEARRVASGIIAFRNSSRTQQFVQNWSEFAKRSDPHFFIEQHALYQAVRSAGFPVGLLRREFIDWELRPDTVIWAAKGDLKFRNPYLRELLKEPLRHSAPFFKRWSWFLRTLVELVWVRLSSAFAFLSASHAPPVTPSSSGVPFTALGPPG